MMTIQEAMQILKRWRSQKAQIRVICSFANEPMLFLNARGIIARINEEEPSVFISFDDKGNASFRLAGALVNAPPEHLPMEMRVPIEKARSLCSRVEGFLCFIFHSTATVSIWED